VAERALLFARPARLTEEARLALEDYARATLLASGSRVHPSDAPEGPRVETIDDDEGYTLGVRVSLPAGPDGADPAISAEIEGFFMSLVESAPDRLGWR
jgi:hypothetical protein